MKIFLLVLIQYTNVTDNKTDRQTNGQTPCDGIGCVYYTCSSVRQKVSSSRRKVPIKEAFWTDGGKEFQALVAATGNAQSPSVERRA